MTALSEILKDYEPEHGHLSPDIALKLRTAIEDVLIPKAPKTASVGQTGLPDRILRLPEVSRVTGKSRSCLYRIIDPEDNQYDPTFPKPKKLGKGRNSSIGWLESGVQAWLASLEAA